MFGKKAKSDRPVWRNRKGKVECPGEEACPNGCDEDCPIAANTDGLQMLMCNQPLLAINHFKKVIEIAPDFPDAYTNLGSAYGMSNQDQKAYECFKKALELRKGYPQAIRGLIVSAKNTGKYDEALHYCDEFEKVTHMSAQDLRTEINKLATIKQ